MIIIALYTLVVVNACFAAIDGALSGVTSLVAVDIVHRYWPQVSERRLLGITKTSMIVAAAVAGGVVLTGIDYVNLVTTVYFYGTSLLIPVTLSIFWSRMTGAGYVWGVIAGVVVGGPLRETLGPTYGPLFGIIGLIAASAVVSVVVSLRQNTRFDFDSLAEGKLGAAGTGEHRGADDKAQSRRSPQWTTDFPRPPASSSRQQHSKERHCHGHFLHRRGIGLILAVVYLVVGALSFLRIRRELLNGNEFRGLCRRRCPIPPRSHSFPGSRWKASRGRPDVVRRCWSSPPTAGPSGTCSR